MSETINVLVPIQLTPEMIDEVMRKNPETSIDDMDERHKRLGWMICVWDILLAMSLEEYRMYDDPLARLRSEAEQRARGHIKGMSPWSFADG